MENENRRISFTRTLFGKAVAFDLHAGEESRALEHELSLYPGANESTDNVLRITDNSDVVIQPVATNPSIHLDLQDGFVATFGKSIFVFSFSEYRLTEIRYLRAKGANPMPPALQKLKSSQFTSHDETVGQRFHELALVPSTFFDPNLCILHATALHHRDGSATLIGGTGGVGKTSSQLSLCTDYGYKFLADDIAVVDADGSVWPNLSYPKIYAYNVRDNPQLRAKLLKGRGPIDRLHWFSRHMIAPKSLRRRISPASLYGSVRTSSTPLSRYIILVRDNSQMMKSQRISAELATQLSLSILKTEYGIFFQHLHWHEANRRLQGRDPVITVDSLFDRWRDLLMRILDKVRCEIVHVPQDIDHADFRREVLPFLT